MLPRTVGTVRQLTRHSTLHTSQFTQQHIPRQCGHRLTECPTPADIGARRTSASLAVCSLLWTLHKHITSGTHMPRRVTFHTSALYTLGQFRGTEHPFSGTPSCVNPSRGAVSDGSDAPGGGGGSQRHVCSVHGLQSLVCCGTCPE